MADLDEIFRTLAQQQDYLAEVGKKIEGDIEKDRERQLAAQREREKCVDRFASFREYTLIDPAGKTQSGGPTWRRATTRSASSARMR